MDFQVFVAWVKSVASFRRCVKLTKHGEAQMPELPEVEVVKRGLSSILGDHSVIEKIEFLRKDLREDLPHKKAKQLAGAKILGLKRRAKYIIIETTQGSMLSHLGMTGTWRLAEAGDERLHDHIYIYLKDGRRLAYRDPRRFGVFDIFSGTQHKKLQELGPEPWDPEFSVSYLKEKLEGKQVPIKVAIMDQKIVVGVGNIYASEALFLAQISPRLMAKKLTILQLEKLIFQIQKVLQQSIEAGGSTISDFAQAGGDKGYFQNQFRVYDKEGSVCTKCKQSKIRSQVLGGRSTFWCPTCQKNK